MLVVAVVSHRMFVPRIRKALLRLRKALGSLRYAQVKERFVQGYRSFCFGGSRLGLVSWLKRLHSFVLRKRHDQ
jgi:hypothetical protein